MATRVVWLTLALVFSLVAAGCGPDADTSRSAVAVDLLPAIDLPASHARCLRAVPGPALLAIDMVGAAVVPEVRSPAQGLYPWAPWTGVHSTEIVLGGPPTPYEPPMPQPICVQAPRHMRVVDFLRLLIGVLDCVTPSLEGNLLVACRAEGGEVVWVNATGFSCGSVRPTLRWSRGVLADQEVRLRLGAGPEAGAPLVICVVDADGVVVREIDDVLAALSTGTPTARTSRRDFQLVVEPDLELGDVLPLLLRLEETCGGRACVGSLRPPDGS